MDLQDGQFQEYPYPDKNKYTCENKKHNRP